MCMKNTGSGAVYGAHAFEHPLLGVGGDDYPGLEHVGNEREQLISDVLLRNESPERKILLAPASLDLCF